jgi:hypothetical protein
VKKVDGRSGARRRIRAHGSFSGCGYPAAQIRYFFYLESGKLLCSLPLLDL